MNETVKLNNAKLSKAYWGWLACLPLLMFSGMVHAAVISGIVAALLEGNPILPVAGRTFSACGSDLMIIGSALFVFAYWPTLIWFARHNKAHQTTVALPPTTLMVVSLLTYFISMGAFGYVLLF